jgi:hypothetical protein
VTMPAGPAPTIIASHSTFCCVSRLASRGLALVRLKKMVKATRAFDVKDMVLESEWMKRCPLRLMLGTNDYYIQSSKHIRTLITEKPPGSIS